MYKVQGNTCPGGGQNQELKGPWPGSTPELNLQHCKLLYGGEGKGGQGRGGERRGGEEESPNCLTKASFENRPHSH